MTSNPLTPNEQGVLRACDPARPLTPAELAQGASLREDQAQPAAEALVVRGLLAREETDRSERLVLTDAGRRQLEAGGTAPVRIREKLRAGSRSIKDAQDLPGLEKAEVGAAFGALKKAGLITVQGDQVSLADGPGWAVHDAFAALLKTLAASAAGVERSSVEAALAAHVEGHLPSKRGKKGTEPLELVTSSVRRYRLTADGAAARAGLGDARAEVAQLTKQMLEDGSWKEARFRAFNVAAPPYTPFARKNPYRAFLDRVKTTLLSLGFEEMTGNLVEPEFWNMDALFLPQHHPAREIHDVYFVEGPDGGHVHAREIEGGALEPVAREHEGRGVSGSRGWGYSFDRERTKRLVLRSQGTVLSARWLQKARTPGKYFAMARCFRYDTVDATHAPDFFQIEGIVSSRQTSFRHLLGLLEVFARQLARSESVKFVPAYFPFTEPSVEVHMRHPDLGWIELGGAGIFRPEVTRPHGIQNPVIAWGLGLDRMAMVALGVSDIRHLFTNNLPDGVGGLRR
jgi:phenylalanyl-tRNA synthetase alpha chain